MATGRVTVGPGQKIGSDWGNDVWDQSIQCFANAADRATQYPSPHPGAISFLEDTKLLYIFRNSSWDIAGPGFRAYSVGAVVWGTYDGAKPSHTIGGYVEGETTAFSSMELDLNIGAPVTCIISVALTPSWVYPESGGFVNTIPSLDRAATAGISNGAHLSVTFLRPASGGGWVGPGVCITGMTWALAVQV